MSTATTEIIARAIIRRDKHLLVVHQHTKSWSFLPGGRVEPGEGVETALARELTEELGTDATVEGFTGAVEHGYLEDSTIHHEVNLIFAVTITEAEPINQEEHLEFHWLPLDQLADTDVRPSALKNALIATGDDRTPFLTRLERLRRPQCLDSRLRTAPQGRAPDPWGGCSAVPDTSDERYGLAERSVLAVRTCRRVE